MSEKIFKSLIKCAHCNKNFVAIKEGDGYKYVCGTSHRTGKCTRNGWSEWKLSEVVSEHCFKNSIPFILSNSHMKEIIKKITIYDTEKYEIEFNNGKICGWDGNKLAL